ncbi:hypothetical protein ACFWNK_27395 [Streptomyces sp. NPDC058417]|uniref:hypothetical protein n=1 Tax=unclassified Streptomyces TaxID=2593676 RepID=UPI00365FF037
MSMHEIEDLVADSVRLLDTHAAPGDPGVRDRFAALYAFQDRHDCSFTHFRVMDALLRRRHTYRFPLDRHPDHAERSAFFDALTGFTGLRTFDEEAPDFDGYDSWLQDGYVDPPFLYCDAGTDLWRRMVDAGELTGPDAVPPRRVPLVDVVRDVALAAEKEGDTDLVALWFAFGCETLVGGPVGCPYDVEELAELPAVRELRAVVRRTGALDAARRSPHAAPLEFAADQDLERWWWTL